jgi:PIN domain
MTKEISENLLELILKQRNTIQTEIYYRWGLITTDFDDNKFLDTAISANADYLVTLDRNFSVIKSIPFPKVEIISLEEFLVILNKIQLSYCRNTCHNQPIKQFITKVSSIQFIDKFIQIELQVFAFNLVVIA